MSITNTVSVAVLGWGIIRRQLFNPLRELAADLRERAHRQELISQISRRTATLLRAGRAAPPGGRADPRLLRLLHRGIFLVDGRELVLRASTLPAVAGLRQDVPPEDRARRASADGSPPAGRPLLVGDVSREPRYVELSWTEVTHTSRARGADPARRPRDRRPGRAERAAVTRSARRTSLTQQTIADQLSSAIENARLYEETRRRAERLALVNRISAAAGSVLDLDDLLETVYREVTPIFEADAFFIALLDARADTLDFRIQVDEGRGSRRCGSRSAPGSPRAWSRRESRSWCTTSTAQRAGGPAARGVGHREGARPPGSACPCSSASG